MDISIYFEKLNHYMTHSRNNMQVLEIEKCCGYSEFTFMYKEATLNELYNSIYYQFQLTRETYNIRLFLKDNLGNEIQVPSNSTKLNDFIKGHRPVLTPIYPVPAQVVYKFYLDDGHCSCGAMH